MKLKSCRSLGLLFDGQENRGTKGGKRISPGPGASPVLCSFSMRSWSSTADPACALATLTVELREMAANQSHTNKRYCQQQWCHEGAGAHKVPTWAWGINNLFVH